MSKRKSRGLEVSPPSLENDKTSSAELPELLSSSSSSSSKSYSSKMIVHEVTSMASKEDDNEEYAKAVTKEMVLVGCPKCYMYVMSSEDEPKCPKCKTTVFLDLFGDED